MIVQNNSFARRHYTFIIIMYFYSTIFFEHLSMVLQILIVKDQINPEISQ